MTNTQVLQFIVEELSKYSLSWRGHKELFELICSPLSFGNTTYQQRKKAKEDIFDLFKSHKTFNKIRFNKLADNILCGENEKKYAHELFDFLREEIVRLEISLDYDLKELIAKIPCRNGQETNYKNNFSNWLNGSTNRINRQEVKHQLEQNFYFSPSLWDQGEYTIKQTIREGVKRFVKKHTKEVDDITNMFEKIRKEFHMKNDITAQEKQSLDKIAQMTQQEIMKYIGTHYPLKKHHSQEFIQKMIPILYQKGYTALLLHYVIEALELPLKGHKEIKKIMAHLYGSPEVGEYLKAFQILESIKSNNDKEIIDIRTEAISNIRRCYLSDKNIDKDNKIEILYTILKFYEDAFTFKESYDYYPAINLAYTVVLHFLFTDNTKESTLIQKISDIHKKCELSIQKDKKQDNLTKKFYANMTQLEFILLKGFKSGVLELERYLEVEEECIPLPELARTHRQMQFFIDNVNTIPNSDQNIIVQNIQKAIVVIDDFMESRKDKIL